MTKGLSEKRKYLHFLIEWLKIGSIGLVNTVLVYKKRSKFKNIFSFWKNMMSQLSNALSVVFISLKLVKLHQIKFLSVATAKGHETLPNRLFNSHILSGTQNFFHSIFGYFLEQLLFLKPTNYFQTQKWYPKISKFLRSKSMNLQLSNALFPMLQYNSVTSLL